MTSFVHYRIVEIAHQLFGQLDACILKYYKNRWPTELHDFTPVTCREPNPHHSPLQMIADSYTVVKTHYPNKQDIDILSAIILFYYSTVVLEYYVLNEAQYYKICLQQKYVSEDGSIIVTQNDEIFQVSDLTVTNGFLPLQKVVLTTSSHNIFSDFQNMSKEHRKEMLMVLSRHLRGESHEMTTSFQHHILPQRFFLNIKDPRKFILTHKDDQCDIFYKIQVKVNGFFHRFQNKEINSILFQIASQEEDWAKQLRRWFHGMEEGDVLGAV